MSVYIRARNLTLDVPVFVQRERSGTGWGDLFLGAAFDAPRRRLVRLLDGIDFEVGEGDRLAILGRNGAGKSTLLRVLNRVYQPTSGTLEVAGSCQALLNIGLGFNDEATVRENIFLRGVAMGLKPAFLGRQIDSILEFSGLREKSTHRLRTLSSGQRLRLGFAISTSIQNDIILMDEWVGAGDVEFMARAKERMQSRVGGSKVVVLASHSVNLLRNICNKGIVLERGHLVHAGDIASSLKAYHELLATLREKGVGTAGSLKAYGRVSRLADEGNGTFTIEGWCFDDEGAVPASLVVQVHGRPCPVVKMVNTSRQDVMHKFGLVHDRCGFQLTFRLPEGVDAEGLSGLQVYAASGLRHTEAPLPMSDEVTGKLKQVAPG